MASKNHTHLTLKLAAHDRAGMRAELFQHWVNEQPGTPSVTNTYRYDVETLRDGSLVYLTRPTRLNKGADFKILCENFLKYKNGNDKPPSHHHLTEEIDKAAAPSHAHKKEILHALQRVWECDPSDNIISSLNLLHGNMQAERTILLAKWLFIEQDVTYWTESGRHRLMAGLKKNYGDFS